MQKQHFVKVKVGLAFIALGIFFQNCARVGGVGLTDATASGGLGGSPGNAAIYDACPVNGLTSSANSVNLQGDCEVGGDISLSDTAKLTITSGNLKIRGNLALRGTSALTVNSGSLTFPQTGYGQYSITMSGQTKLRLNNSNFVTNQTQKNNFSMALDANDSAVVDFENSTLNTNTGSWLLGNFNNESKLISNGSQNLPTEVYPGDAASISIKGGSALAGIWLNLPTGSNAAVAIPSHDSQGNYNFSFGPSTGISYTVNVSASQGRLGFNSHPGSTTIVNGNGTSGANDVGVVFGYYIENSTGPVSIKGLGIGSDISKQFTDQGRNLQLNHVNLNPFSWQVYVSQSNGYPVSVSNSIINEIAALTNGIVLIDTCVLQLAVAGAEAPGAVMSISNTQIWSQAIQAQNGGRITIRDSQLHGNYLSAMGAGSVISMTNVADSGNGIAPQSCTSAGGYPPNNNGQPLCNPFNPLYQCAQVEPVGGGAIIANPGLSCPH